MNKKYDHHIDLSRLPDLNDDELTIRPLEDCQTGIHSNTVRSSRRISRFASMCKKDLLHALIIKDGSPSKPKTAFTIFNLLSSTPTVLP